MSTQLLVLLFALVMENQIFAAAALFHVSPVTSAATGASDLAGLALDRQHVTELNFRRQCRCPDFLIESLAGRPPVLLSTGADDRVQYYASVQSYARRALARFREPSCCACCFPRRRLEPRMRDAQNGAIDYSKPIHFSVRCGKASKPGGCMQRPAGGPDFRLWSFAALCSLRQSVAESEKLNAQAPLTF